MEAQVVVIITIANSSRCWGRLPEFWLSMEHIIQKFRIEIWFLEFMIREAKRF